jgi:hypothetical protein
MNTKSAKLETLCFRVLPRAVILAAVMLTAVPAVAAEVRYVGAILNGPSAPTSLTISDHGIGVLEPYARQVEVFTADGVLESQVNIKGDARGLALLQDRIYLFCDDDAATVYAVDLDDGRQWEFLGGLAKPVDVIVSGNHCFVLDGDRRSVVVCGPDGGVQETVALPNPTGMDPGWLADLAYDHLRQIFYVFDQTNSRVLAYSRTGVYQGDFCGFGTHEGEVSRGGEIVCDSDGWIFITDRYQGRVVVFDSAWNFQLNVDSIDFGQDRLMTPTGFAVDSAGFLYVAATEGASIHIFHLDKSTTSVGDLLARAVSPGTGDDLPVDNLQFVAGVQAPANQAHQVVADFRLFDLADMITPVAEATNVPLVGGTVIGDSVAQCPFDRWPSLRMAGQDQSGNQ